MLAYLAFRCPPTRTPQDDGAYDASVELTNAAGLRLRERHVPRASFDEEPSDTAALAVLRKAGARW
jgi:hypothetical protein